MKKEPKTNQAWIKDIMNFAPTGMLGEVFVIEAVRRYAEQVAAAEPLKGGAMLIDGDAWKRTGEWIKAQYDSNY